MSVGKRIQKARQAKNMTLEDIAKLLKISRQTLSRYETGVIQNIPSDKIEEIAKILDTTPAVLMGWDDGQPESEITATNIITGPRRMIPILGNVAAGVPIWANEEHEQFVDGDDYPNADFALRVIGDSMAPLFEDGDLVYVKKQTTVQNGEIGIVLDGDSATMKYVYMEKDGITLSSHNPRYKPMVYTGGAAAELRIIGVPLGHYRPYLKNKK